MASSSGLDLKAARHLSAALQITFDRAQAVGSLRLFRPHHFQQLSKQRQDIGPTIQLSCPSKPFLYPEAGESGPIARCVSLRRVHQTHHSIQLTVPHTPRALINYDFSMFGGLNMDHISPWRFRLVDQQPASGLLDLGILVPSSAILPLAMLEPKYSMVP